MMIYWEDYEVPTVDEDTIICFDIEVSSFWIDDDYNIIEYDNTISDDTYNNWGKGSCVYIWQLSIDDDIIYGREFSDAKIIIDELLDNFLESDDESVLTIWSHNLSYEIQFLRSLYTFDSVFARSERKPMYATCGKLQFRCSYMLTNKSLATWGSELGIPKKIGDLEYNKLRTPLSNLNEKELGYCEYDLRIMIAGLRKYLKKYNHISKIPLTATGEVRREVNALYNNNMRHRFKVTKMQPKDDEEYAIFKSVFAGGDCHTHIIYTGLILVGVGSEDIQSDYPFQLIAMMYPSEPFFFTMEREGEWNFEKNAYIFHLKLYDIESKGTLIYLAYSRCKVVTGLVNDNGRIYSATFVDLWCTEQEYNFIFDLYDIKYYEIECVLKSRKKYLDTDFIKYILGLYKDKTQLKGAESPELQDLYRFKKGLLNSMYGLCVQDPLQSDVTLDASGWHKSALTKDVLIEKLQEIQSKPWKNNLAYTTGIWCTAYARAMLWKNLLAVGDDVVYYDTDSIKFLNVEKHLPHFEEENKKTLKILEKAMRHHNLTLADASPEKDGKSYPLGIWDFEGISDRAVFLGAKKYAVEKNGKIKITVSGVPKVASKCLKSLEDFKEGFVFDREICNKNQSHYIDGDNYCGYMPDGYFLNQPFGLNIRPCGYTLDLTEDYKNLIKIVRG